jgi:hypothetical protein
MFRTIIREKWKQCKASVVGQWINKIWHIHTVDNNPTIKKNKLLIPTKDISK